MDRRQQKTRALIINSFSKLLISKPYSKITVQDIIDEANIGRSTFYSHFETKEILLDELCKELFHHVFSNDLKSENNHDFSNKPNNLREYISHILHHIKEDSIMYEGLLLSQASDIFYSYIKAHFNEWIRNNLAINYIIDKEYLVNHICSSFIESIKWWIKNNMKETPETLASYYLSTIEHIL